MQRQQDIVIVADPRFPGGTSTAIAAEIEAQARAGYRTGLIALKAAVLKYPHPIHPKIRAAIDAGWCELLDPEAPVSAGLALLHHPLLLEHLPARPLRLDADVKRLIVHQPPLDGEGQPFYDWRRVDRHAAVLLGGHVPWAPVGPAVRRQLERLPDPPQLADEDWHNVLDPDAWLTARLGVASPVPVIGRHSRPDLLKWPATRADTLVVYPEADDVRVRAMGVDAALLDRLAPIPANWQVLPFATEGVVEFLRGLDVYVYFHHPRWVEAFGRGIIEAMAAGLPAILPRSFAPLFGDAALYAEPEAAAGEARALHGDVGRWRRRSDAAITAVRERFSYPRHVARVAALIGAPAAATAAARRRRPRTVLFMTSNGIGLGHVSRALAIARRCPPELEPVFVTLSQGARLIEEAGYQTEYLPFHAYLGADVNRWNDFLARDLAEIVAFYDPSVIVFDGNTPYSGLVQTLRRTPAAWGVWVRRGFWRAGVGGSALERESAFDCVIEPADLAEMLDTGPTTASRTRTRRVPPVQLVEPAALLNRDEARRRLDLPPDHTCVLFQLGAANNYDFAVCQQRCLDLLLARPKTTAAFLESPISLETPKLPEGVRTLRLFPASLYLRAFDFAVSASGYNSYHELLLSGTPALFVPNEHPQTDDQLARAEHAERMGFGLVQRTRELYRLMSRLEILLDADERAAMRRRMERLDRRNGAIDAALILTEMAFTVRADRGA
jgi:UDP:flavonoid glycosyltransferase YjiC (YdhE family)